MLNLSSAARIGLAIGGLAIASTVGGVLYVNDAYITGPKHEPIEAKGVPMDMSWSGDMRFKDFAVDVGGDQTFRMSLWKPNPDIEPQAFRDYPQNMDSLTEMVFYNWEQRDGPRESLQLCDFTGYGRVGYVDGLHHFLIEDVLAKIAPGEYAQQTRFNVTAIDCEAVPISPNDPIWTSPFWTGEGVVTSGSADGYGTFHAVK